MFAELLHYYKDYFATAGRWKHTALVGLFLAFYLALELALDLSGNIDALMGSSLEVLAYFVLYSIPYFFALFTERFFIHPARRMGREFAAVSLLAILFLSLSSGFNMHVYLIAANVEREHRMAIWHLLTQVRQALFLFVGPWLLWLVFRKASQPIYGLAKLNSSLKPYFLFLAVIAPLVVAVSFLPDFRKAYPAVAGTLRATAPDEMLSSLFYYEVLYMIAYVATEFFFRGLMVDGFRNWNAESAILPMAALYMSVHFGKPVGETISSFFGGMILGILTYYTRSIIGGIIAHMGLAGLMELAGALQRYWLHPSAA